MTGGMSTRSRLELSGASGSLNIPLRLFLLGPAEDEVMDVSEGKVY
jgi:hypothetical protein